ncbi:MAG: HAD-IB family hydrolase [Pseudomonadales bacterium]|uniref:HAD-superfamily hydrolase n=1 Tax=Oleiphilus messinensis TaxID=141451 RepID=A0A1Y0I5Z7_9GAMM|nr:HAD family hydrolase [Oleiphilus messinensis]ARU54864.1 HAD-superfamily hydrolase [Oleiphilus messinensis]MCG8614197.1 HAD-IB family hydrolase [Pseudomonadales bacterium]
MALAIFDLDNTLIAGDSDHAWGQFLVEEGIVDAITFKRANDQFYQDYLDGCLDMDKYLEFSLAPLAQFSESTLLAWREQFIEQKIQPMILEKALELLAEHRQKQDKLLIITATNEFVTEPIAKILDIPHLIATVPEKIDNCYTGRATGVPSFQSGKVERLNAWLESENETLAGSSFYSDSHNDLPLLNVVEYPVAVDPDVTLRNHAETNNWKVISLR